MDGFLLLRGHVKFSYTTGEYTIKLRNLSHDKISVSVFHTDEDGEITYGVFFRIDKKKSTFRKYCNYVMVIMEKAPLTFLSSREKVDQYVFFLRGE